MESIPFDFDIDQYLNPFLPSSRLHRLPKFVSWFLGYRSSPTARIGSILILFWSFLGATLGILLVEAVFHTAALGKDGVPIIFASLGATAILEYNAVDSPLAQPRNALLGQIFSATIGISVTKLFQLNPNFEALRWIAGALSVGTASAVMGMTKTIHPPAGATALLAATSPEVTALGWLLLPLIMLGIVLMLAVACLLNNIQRQFPMYWWTPLDLESKSKDDVENQNEATKVQGHSTLEGEPKIIIEPHRLVIPKWTALAQEDITYLEELQMKLKQGLGRLDSTTTTTTTTKVND